MSYKLSPSDLSLVSIFIKIAKAAGTAKSVPATDTKLQLIIEAEECIAKLKAGFDPAVSNRLWNISKDPILVNDSEFIKETNGAKCAISFIQAITETKIEEWGALIVAGLSGAAQPTPQPIAPPKRY